MGVTLVKRSEELSSVDVPVVPKAVELVTSEPFDSVVSDLERYKGCSVKKWEYAVLNYPEGVRNVKATILISGSRVIGGDISAEGKNKFTHSLLLSAETQNTRQDEPESR